MSVFYADESVVLHHGDCLEVTDWLDADVLVTDPPYGFGHYETDVMVLTPEMLCEWTRAAVFGYPEQLVALCVAAQRTPDEWLTWWPTNGAIRGMNLHGLWKESECVAIFGDHQLSQVRRARGAASARILDAQYRSRTGKSRLECHGQPDSRRAGDVWTDAAPGLAFQSHMRLHPNEKPVSLMERLVSGMAPGTIADPFAGSGTTLVAAKQLGRKAIGVEIDERYCETAAKRLAQGVLDFEGAS